MADVRDLTVTVNMDAGPFKQALDEMKAKIAALVKRKTEEEVARIVAGDPRDDARGAIDRVRQKLGAEAREADRERIKAAEIAMQLGQEKLAFTLLADIEAAAADRAIVRAAIEEDARQWKQRREADRIAKLIEAEKRIDAQELADALKASERLVDGARQDMAQACSCRRDAARGTTELNPTCPVHGRVARGLDPTEFGVSPRRPRSDEWMAEEALRQLEKAAKTVRDVNRDYDDGLRKGDVVKLKMPARYVGRQLDRLAQIILIARSDYREVVLIDDNGTFSRMEDTTRPGGAKIELRISSVVLAQCRNDAEIVKFAQTIIPNIPDAAPVTPPLAFAKDAFSFVMDDLEVPRRPEPEPPGFARPRRVIALEED